MAITSGTLTMKRSWIGTNKYLLTLTMTATGDGSGGTIAITTDISSYIPQNSTVSIVNCTTSQTDDASRVMSINVTASSWESMGNGWLIVYNANAVGTATNAVGTQYTSTLNSYAQRIPVFLGRPTVSTASYWNVASGTNTNTKVYEWTTTFEITQT